MARDIIQHWLFARTLHAVERLGVYPVMVGGPVDDEGGGGGFFVYSIGFRSLGHPDIILTGIRPDKAANVIWTVFQAVKAGRPRRPNDAHDDVAEGLLTYFRPVHDFWRERLMLHAGPIYEHLYHDPAFTAMHAIYPDLSHLCVHAAMKFA